MRIERDSAVLTLIDLWLGILLYFIFFEIMGLIFAVNGISYTLGLLTGCLTAGLLAWNMYGSIDRALELTEQEAVKYFQKNSIYRILVMLVVAVAAINFAVISFPAVMIGMLSLKSSAFFQPCTHLCITKKLFQRRGR